MTLTQFTKPSSSPIAVTLKRLIALLEEDQIDEVGILQPTHYAFTSAMRLVVETYEAMGDRFPKASASTDEHGGIRLTWSKLEPECEIRLVCPDAGDRDVYLYHELGDAYGVEREVSAASLVQWLEWMNRA